MIYNANIIVFKIKVKCLGENSYIFLHFHSIQKLTIFANNLYLIQYLKDEPIKTAYKRFAR